jgi:hypothetical protein
MNQRWIDRKLADARHRWTPQMMYVSELHAVINADIEKRLIPIIFKRMKDNHKWWMDSLQGGKFPEGAGEVK